jgi:small subunit ribosomal protein S16
MLAIRLARIGAKKQAAYRVVVMEKSRARNSRSVEILGHYNPRRNPTEVLFDEERVQYWLGKGAQPSVRVARLLKDYKERPAQTQASTAKGEAKPAAAAAPAEKRAEQAGAAPEAASGA